MRPCKSVKNTLRLININMSSQVQNIHHCRLQRQHALEYTTTETSVQKQQTTIP